MLRALLGFLGLLIVLAIVTTLAQNPPDAVQQFWESGQARTRAKDPSAPQKGDGHKKLVSSGAREAPANKNTPP